MACLEISMWSVGDAFVGARLRNLEVEIGRRHSLRENAGRDRTDKRAPRCAPGVILCKYLSMLL